MMDRVLFDANIYGLLITDRDFHKLHSVIEQQDVKIYGLDIIRKELKAAPSKLIGGVNTRASLLRAYTSFVCKEYETEKSFVDLADKYYTEYHKNGGIHPEEKLHNDFVIVACASMKEIPIVVSEDNATMASELAQAAYKEINNQLSIKVPTFIKFNEFKIKVNRTF